MDVADNVNRLKTSLQRLAKFHRQQHGVTPYMMVEAIDAFEAVIIPYLQRNQCGQHHIVGSTVEAESGIGNTSQLATDDSSNYSEVSLPKKNSKQFQQSKNLQQIDAENKSHMEEDCETCGTWTRFLGLLRTVISESFYEEGFNNTKFIKTV